MLKGMLKNVVGSIAPSLGSAVGGPLGGMATKIICETLGCNSDAKSIQTAINNASPEDKKDARGKFSKDWTARIMGIATVGGFLGYIFLVTLQPPEQNSEALINLVLGYLGGLASAVISFYFGASNSSDKGE